MEIIKLMQIKNKLRIRTETESNKKKTRFTNLRAVSPEARFEQWLFVDASQQDPCLKYPKTPVFVEHPLKPMII